VQKRILEIFAEHIELVKEAEEKAPLIVSAAEMVARAFAEGRKLLVFGNGGSAADAQHIAAEFVNRFIIERPALPAIALTTDTSILTSVGNDYGNRMIFSKQIKALGQEGDVALAISTSGNSPNVLEALNAARDRQLKTILMTGAGGGKAVKLADLWLEVNSKITPRTQEIHILWGHLLCELVDFILFQKPGEEG
jgi:D-sedoheptulose 7-phosphate isomerase